MDFEDTEQEAMFRRQARAWLLENAPAAGWEAVVRQSDRFLPLARDWQARKARDGWACLHWPTEHGGRGASMSERLIWSQEEGEYFTMGLPFAIGIGMAGPTLIAYATDTDKARYLPKIASGEEIWCQLFSEPSAGSDLAGIRTRAVQADDGSGDWIINGQKIWTSVAHLADYGILLARSDASVPKHKGLTFFYLNMKSAGIDVRPIRQMSGGSDFNEVFLEDVRIPDSQRLGAVGEGWSVAMTTLMAERAVGTAMFPSMFGHMLDLTKSVTIDGVQASEHRAVRERLADWFVKTNGLKFAEYRMVTAEGNGIPPGPEASITKLVSGKGRQEMSALMLDLQGMVGALAADEKLPQGGRFHHAFLRAAGNRIEAGTDEILRNVIAERLLGLPADYRPDKGISFSQSEALR